MKLLLGDCIEVLKTLPAASVDAVVTDPPYGLSFMGKRWDYDVPTTEVWAECLRVLKPGGHLLAFAGTRTQHWMAVRIEDAGFEIRDMIAWVYGSGFPKSLDVSKAIDKAAGAEREVVGLKDNKGRAPGAIACKGLNVDAAGDPITVPATPEAQQWAGWGTALKPALEPITMARKPLEGTVAANVLAHGTGGLNVDGCRVHGGPSAGGSVSGSSALGQGSGWNAHSNRTTAIDRDMSSGRWPANLIHDGSDEVVGLFPERDGAVSNSSPNGKGGTACYGTFGATEMRPGRGDTGSAARFFYTSKASRSERGEGNNHPTVKPIALMRYLCRLVTPPGAIVLDPFMGSGTTGKAALLEGFDFIGIERDPQYFAIAQARVNNEPILVDSGDCAPKPKPERQSSLFDLLGDAA